MECIGSGTARVVLDGPCNEDSLTLDLAVKLMEEAIEKAEQDATKDCPKGCKCEGKATPDPPSCWSFTEGGKPKQLWEVRARFDGKCVCPDDQGKPGKLKGKNLREFFKKVSELPELPAAPKGKCQMYKQQRGHGFWYPVCAGECKKGACKTIVTVEKESATAECDCR